MQGLGDRINELCNTHFTSLHSKGKPSTSQWTVLSAVVMEMNEELSVVAMATGTKCVGEKDKGMYVVGDSHAEILSLRLFRLFLVKEMSALSEGSEDGGWLSRNNQGFGVKLGVSFHFYSSCVMCGDATIHVSNQKSFENTRDNDQNDHRKCDFNLKRPPSPLSSTPSKQFKTTPSAPSPNTSPLQEITRSGGKCLLSDDLTSDSLKTRSWTITSVLRTKPGRGPLSLSLSCSDKLMKRQALGLQGGLLSSLIPQPIRFQSVVIGGEFSEESVKRALFTRLPEHYQFAAEIIQVEDIFSHSLQNISTKNDNVSIQNTSSSNNETVSHQNISSTNSGNVTPASTALLWCRGAGQWVGVKGRQQGGTKTSAEEKVALPVCRANMMRLVGGFILSGSEFEELYSGNGKVSRSNYEELKQISSAYRENKDQFCAHFTGWKKKWEECAKIA